MKFDSLQAFLDMGGYGFYVWLSYGVSLGLLTLLLISSLSAHKKVKQQIQQKQKREQKLRKAAQMQAQAVTD